MEGRVEVYMDGGVRQGTDVVKALAMGARAVFIGRPILWGLTYNVRPYSLLYLIIFQLFLAGRRRSESGCSDSEG